MDTPKKTKNARLERIKDVPGLLTDLLILNLLWLLTSLPVLTLGASTSAAYAVLLRYVRDGGVPVTKTFFRCFKENFLQATVLWLLAIGLAAVVYIDWRFAGTVTGTVHTLYSALAIVLLVAIAVLLTLAIPIQAYYRNTLGNIIKNAFAMAFCAPGQMLLIWLFWAAIAAFCILVPFEIVARAGILLLLWGFALPAWLASRQILKIFRIFE